MSLFAALTAAIFTWAAHASQNETHELDRPDAWAQPSFEIAQKHLPKTLVMRVDENGEVSVAHVKEHLEAQPDLEKLKSLEFVKVEPEKEYHQNEFGEIDETLGREAWHYVYRPFFYRPYPYVYYPNYYPTYYYAGFSYQYRPYFYYGYGGYYYYYYGW